MNSYAYEKVNDRHRTRNKPQTMRWTQKPLVRQVLISSCMWASYFQIGLFTGLCPVLVAQLRQEASARSDVIDHEAASWISSTGTFSAIPCVLLLSLMTEYLGRKISYLFICFTTLASFVVFYFSMSYSQIILSLILQGPLLGGDMIVCLLIASECVSPKYRGVFLTIKTATVFWGVWVANAVGTFFHWKNIGIIGIACAVYSTLIMPVCPESPYWLASKGRIIKCKDAHRWLKGTDEDAEKELESLISSKTEISTIIGENKTLYNQLLFYVKKITAPQFYQPIILSSLLILMLICSGKLMLTMYAIDIIKKVTSSESVAYMGMLILDGITVLGMYAGCAISRYARRRTLLFSTEFVGIFFLFSLSLYIYLIKEGLIIENAYLAISLLLAFSLSISCGPLILNTSLVGELSPLELRTAASFILCVIFKVTTAASYKLAPLLFLTFGEHLVFLFLAISSLVLATILLKYLPETKNKTLYEIESFFKKDESNTKAWKESLHLVGGIESREKILEL